MPIDGINAAMTPLQFARAATRSVETTTSTSPHAAGGRSGAFSVPVSAGSPSPSIDRFVGPATFHWSYRPLHVNGKRAAKRTPQLADTSYWSFTLDRLG